MKSRNVRIALVMGAVLGIAACDGYQGSPTPPGPPAPPVTSLTISGETSISDPGGTTQLTATATYSDDTTWDVTAEARWSQSNSDPLTAVVSVISGGLIRAERYGKARVQASYTSGRGAASANAEVRVAPDGAYLVTVAVSDHGYATEAARVQATWSAGTFSVTTDLWGVVSLPAVKETMIQVEKAGFRTITRSMAVNSDQIIEFALQPSDAGA
jgi:hypothetical protein